MTFPRCLAIYQAGALVAEVWDEPGPLVTRLAPPPPPGTEPVTHHRFSSTAYVPEHEGQLRDLLDAASSLDDLSAKACAHGYHVEELATDES